MVCIPERRRCVGDPMIGAAKSSLAMSAPTTPALSGYVVPSSIDVVTSNGTYITATITAYASGGTPPYTYTWRVVGGNATLYQTSGNTTKLKDNGYNTVDGGFLYCDIEDSLSAIVSPDVRYEIEFR